MKNGGGGGGDDDAETDALYDEAVQFVLESRRASISAVQRKLKNRLQPRGAHDRSHGNGRGRDVHEHQRLA